MRWVEQIVSRRVLYPEQGNLNASKREYRMRQDGDFHGTGHCRAWYQVAARPALLALASHAVQRHMYIMSAVCL